MIIIKFEVIESTKGKMIFIEYFFPFIETLLVEKPSYFIDEEHEFAELLKEVVSYSTIKIVRKYF